MKMVHRNVEWMTNYLCSKYRTLDYESTKDIIQSFCKVAKHEILKGNELRINRVGTFGVKQKAQKHATDIFRNKRIVPQMYVANFKTAKTFRTWLGEEDNLSNE